MSGKVHIDPDLGEVFLRKSARARRVSIRVHPTRGITVTVPFYVPYATGLAFLASRREWALEALQRARGRNADLPEGESVESLRAQAKASRTTSSCTNSRICTIPTTATPSMPSWSAIWLTISRKTLRTRNLNHSFLQSRRLGLVFPSAILSPVQSRLTGRCSGDCE